MTTLQLHSRTTVRMAGLVDVPAVVRLFAPATNPATHPTSNPATHPEHSAVDWEQAQRAMRLMLAHHALEEGQVWVAERDDGTLLAAAVWLPPGTGLEPPPSRFSDLLTRELAACPPGPPVLPAALRAAGPGVPHWTVVAVRAPDETEAWDHAVVAELLAPGLRAVDEDDATAVTVTVSARHTDQLRSLGFRGPREVPVAPGASVWLATRSPRSRPRS